MAKARARESPRDARPASATIRGRFAAGMFSTGPDLSCRSTACAGNAVVMACFGCG